MSEQRDIFSVGRLNLELRHAVEGSFPLLWVQGEISNLARPRSGHMYFTLKDAQAQIRCALFRNRRNQLRFQPDNGDLVLARARVTFYEPRGDCQLVVEYLEPAGAGLLQQAFEQLKQKLQAEGLFDERLKRALPAFPRVIGVISSPSGAALRDVLQVLRRRYPLARVVLYPSSVQGAAAPAELRHAVELAGTRGEADVLVLTRGGGSLEDLAAFNEEPLARAIAACPIPLVSAVGHEVDFTIADLVADRRAPTPSAAAELVSPDAQDLERRIGQLGQRLHAAMAQRIRHSSTRLGQWDARLQRLHPGSRLRQQTQRLDELQLRLGRTMERRLQTARQRLGHQQQRLAATSPDRRIAQVHQQYGQQSARLHAAIRRTLQRTGERLEARARQLHAVSPLAVLGRGYSITGNAAGALVRSVQQIQAGEMLTIRVSDGEIDARAETVKKSGSE